MCIFHTLKEVLSSDWKRQDVQIKEFLGIWVEMMQRLDDAGRSLSTSADLITPTVDLGLQMNGKIVRLFHTLSAVINHQTRGLHTNVQPDHWKTTKRAVSALASTITPFTYHACKPSNLNIKVLVQINLELRWHGAFIFRDESCFILCPGNHRRHILKRRGKRGDPALNIVHGSGL